MKEKSVKHWPFWVVVCLESVFEEKQVGLTKGLTSSVVSYDLLDFFGLVFPVKMAKTKTFECFFTRNTD